MVFHGFSGVAQCIDKDIRKKSAGKSTERRLVGRYVRVDDRLRTLGLCVKVLTIFKQLVITLW